MSFCKYIEDNIIKGSFNLRMLRKSSTYHTWFSLHIRYGWFFRQSVFLVLSWRIFPTLVTIMFNMTTLSSGWKFWVEKLLANIFKPKNTSKVAASITLKDTQNAHQANIGFLTHLECTIIGHLQRTSMLYKINICVSANGKSIIICTITKPTTSGEIMVLPIWSHTQTIWQAPLDLTASSRCLLSKTL